MESNSSMREVATEIQNAINLLCLSEKDIQLIDPEISKIIYKDSLDYYVKSGDRRWWWEDFKLPYFNFKKFDLPFNHLNEIIPKTDGKVC